MTASAIYQVNVRRGRQCGIDVYPHRFRHHFSHTWLDHGGAEGDLMERNGWTSPQMLRQELMPSLLNAYVGALEGPVRPEQLVVGPDWSERTVVRAPQLALTLRGNVSRSAGEGYG